MGYRKFSKRQYAESSRVRTGRPVLRTTRPTRRDQGGGKGVKGLRITSLIRDLKVFKDYKIEHLCEALNLLKERQKWEQRLESLPREETEREVADWLEYINKNYSTQSIDLCYASLGGWDCADYKYNMSDGDIMLLQLINKLSGVTPDVDYIAVRGEKPPTEEELDKKEEELIKYLEVLSRKPQR
ncbi:MAG: hypothetical protein QXD04_03560 [Candidatus Bathyarchaeia archaeon]